MDIHVLKGYEVEVFEAREGVLEDYKLNIGSRASLCPSVGDKAYGILMALREEDISKLYSEESVSDYLPEEVLVKLADGKEHDASCYNLPEEMLVFKCYGYHRDLHHVL